MFFIADNFSVGKVGINLILFDFKTPKETVTKTLSKLKLPFFFVFLQTLDQIDNQLPPPYAIVEYLNLPNDYHAERSSHLLE